MGFDRPVLKGVVLAALVGAGIALACAEPTAAQSPARTSTPAAVQPAAEPATQTSAKLPDTLPPPFKPVAAAVEMVVPLKEGAYYVADVPVRIAQDQSVTVPAAPFLAAAARVLRPETVAAIKTKLAGAEAAALDVYRAAGIGLTFDPLKVELAMVASVDQRARGAVSVLPYASEIASESAAKPAVFSAYVNTRLAADYLWQSDAAGHGAGNSQHSASGLDAPRVDLEGAARFRDIVIEAEATLEGDRQHALSGLKGRLDDDPRIVRRGTRAVYDLPGDAIRFKAGDVDVLRTSYQHGAGVLGVSAERAYGLLQPGRNIRSTGKRSFRVERPSNVTVRLDGIVFKQVRLEAGDYDLNDLPLRSGANDIQLVIEDDVGGRQVLDFTSFSSMTLLAKGVDEWGVTAGLNSKIRDGELNYDTGAPTASVFYRLGLTEQLTGGIHAQGDGSATMSGIAAVLETGFGLFALEAAGSLHADYGAGYAASLGYDLAHILDSFGYRHSLRLGAETWSQYFATAGIDEPANERLFEFSAHYSRTLPFDVTAAVSGRYGFMRDHDKSDRYSVSGSMHRQFGPDVSLGIVLSYQSGNERAEDNGTSAIVRLGWRPDERSFVDVSHETLDHRSRARYGRFDGEGVGSWNTDVTIENGAGDGTLAVSGGVQYVANRARVSVSHYTTGDALYGLKGGRFDGSISENRSSVRVETAVAFADGRFAIGRPVTNSFAIIDTHATLAGRGAEVGRNSNRVEVQSDGLGPLLVPDVSPYSTTRLQYDVADLPPGYDLGPGAFDLVAPHRAGYSLEVGSAYTVTAYGTLVGSDGEPVALLTGTAKPLDGATGRDVQVFTNRTGRFSAQGLAPGRWRIDMRSDVPETFVIAVPSGTVGLFDAGTLRSETSQNPQSTQTP